MKIAKIRETEESKKIRQDLNDRISDGRPCFCFWFGDDGLGTLEYESDKLSNERILSAIEIIKHSIIHEMFEE